MGTLNLAAPWCFSKRAGLSRHRVSPSLFLSSSSHTTQTLHYTNRYTYSHPNLNFLQYTIQILVPHVTWSTQAVRDSEVDHTQRHLSALVEPEARNSAVDWHWNTNLLIENRKFSYSKFIGIPKQFWFITCDSADSWMEFIHFPLSIIPKSLYI